MGGLGPQRDSSADGARSAWVLASASPRRFRILREAGQQFTVEPSGIDEIRRPGESPPSFAARMALEKAAAVSARLPRRWVLGADTVVALDGEALGKPSSAAEAAAMLRALSGRSHAVVTGFALLDELGRPFRADRVSTEVVFRRLTRDEIDRYVASGEPLDKAGAYAIQAGARPFVDRVRGSMTNVIGLPLDEVRRALEEAGLWRPAR